ncbi:uncharacterized protein LOC141913919 [Tubulanus polymorphus]|uniref:uncharacterized protein LOC141913919 n=1 Tax=Tubulanus polymorphus TaxID=672921 RepID=UPI003DA2B877
MVDRDVEKPSFLILGGVGFIGRNLVHHLLANDLSDKIYVVDRVPPVLAWLNTAHKEAFAKVTFKQVNLINPNSVDALFDQVTDENDKRPVDFVVNLATETKYGQTGAVYDEGILKLSLNCARAAARCRVSRFVELSTAQMHSSDKHPVTEETPHLSPWTLAAKYKLKVEEALRKIDGLNYVIIRPAIVYGIGDRLGLTPRLIIGAVYKELGEKMNLLWTKDLRMNTVDVRDVCSAIYHLCYHGDSGHVFNLVDKNCTTQGVINELISSIFRIQYDYAGTVVSNMARLNMQNVVADINSKHMAPWASMCRSSGIDNSPLNPYLDQELLYNKHVNMDGSKIEGTGFVYKYPVLTKEALQQVLDDYVELGIFPKTA